MILLLTQLAAAGTPTRHEADILATLDAYSDVEADLAAYAYAHARDPAVRAFAADLLDDNRMLGSVVQGRGLDLGIAVADGARAATVRALGGSALTHLSTRPGATFDETFLTLVVDLDRAALASTDAYGDLDLTAGTYTFLLNAGAGLDVHRQRASALRRALERVRGPGTD